MIHSIIEAYFEAATNHRQTILTKIPKDFDIVQLQNFSFKKRIPRMKDSQSRKVKQYEFLLK